MMFTLSKSSETLDGSKTSLKLKQGQKIHRSGEERFGVGQDFYWLLLVV